MLKKHNRITLSKDYTHIHKSGQKIFTPYFLFVCVKSNNAEPPRIGFIASKKIGNAVERNLSKRKLREIFREYLHLMPNGLNAVIIASPKTKMATYKNLKDSVEGVLKKANLLVYQDK